MPLRARQKHAQIALSLEERRQDLLDQSTITTLEKKEL